MSFDDGTGSALYAGEFNYGTSFRRWHGGFWSTFLGGGLSGALALATNYGHVFSLAVADDGSGPALFAAGDFLWASGQPSAALAKWAYAGPPAVKAQPVTHAVDPGSAATLSVSAIGTPPLAYQWRRNGADVPGATASTLTLPTNVPTDVVTYDVVISNPCGTTTTAPATVVVRAAALTVAQPWGPGSLFVTNAFGPPGWHYFTCFTFATENVSNPLNGFWFGLHIPYPELVAQFLVQVPPFVGVLDAAGGSVFAVGPGTLPGSLANTRVFALTAVYDGSTLDLLGASSVESLLLQ